LKIAILGGTGTLGRELAAYHLRVGHDVSIFSRCELKQKEMQADFRKDPMLKQYSALEFTIGDIRDRKALGRFLSRRDFTTVYHVAALKHVDSIEANPEESIETNVLGTINVADAVEAVGVPYCVFSSTDKAVDPINVYGMSKGISERILFNRNKAQKTTQFAVFRWGNVISSRGSVIPAFAEALRAGKTLRVTNPEMTRFWIRVDEAVEFMATHHKVAYADQAMIPPMKGASVLAVVEALAAVLSLKTFEFEVIGNRGGEKVHESIRSIHEEHPLSSNTAPQFTHEELVELLGAYSKTRSPE
jgi:FlaA1/EpsC-like NDP-sugar epimerase